VLSIVVGAKFPLNKKDPCGRVSKLCFRRKRFGLWSSSCQALVLEGSDCE